MKKLINYIKDFYQNDLENLMAIIFIVIFFYVIYKHIINIIL